MQKGNLVQGRVEFSTVDVNTERKPEKGLDDRSKYKKVLGDIKINVNVDYEITIVHS